MTRWVILVILMTTAISCTTRRPTLREPVVAEFQRSNRSEVMETLTKILEAEQIPISRTNLQKGTIETDSFEVLPEYCDCGMNFFGAQYPGTRRGKMRILVSGSADTNIKFEFATLLNITANNRRVKCTSFGLLEEKILTEMEKRLGIARSNAQN
jgi:hypothetical protein